MANSNVGMTSKDEGGAKHQELLNFHGQDTRVGFTSFLHRDFRKNYIHAFIDDEELRAGEQISGERLQAIDNSQIYISIFSINYASSKGCLHEIKRMVHNTSKSEEKKILSIFYNVELDDVDLKAPLSRMAIEKHKKQQEKFPHEVESWEEALKKVNKINGWVLQKCKSQAKLVDLVVEEVLHGLKIRYKFVTKDLVGLDGRVAEVLDFLDENCIDEVRLLGLHGMGCIGKTTLANVVYNELYSRFGKCCALLDDVRETSKKEDLVWLHKKLLIEIDSSCAVEIIRGVDYGRERIKATPGSKNILIVLNDIDKKEKIENLIGQDRLHPGTRMIITTSNTCVLEIIEQRMACEMEMNSNHALHILPYKMKGMQSYHAFQVFKRHAFSKGPLAKDFDSLSRDIVNITEGLPLALEIIGTLLCGKNEVIWKETLHKLKEIPEENVQKQLMISYDTLNDRASEIFLNGACFFINEDMTNGIYMWTDYKFYPNLEIDVLVSMSLIKTKNNNKLRMHDLLRDLEREIVRQENPKNPTKRSRLWTSNEVLDLVTTKEREEDVEAIDLQGKSSHISISHEEIERFRSLRLLRLYNGTFLGDFIVSLLKLRWMSWSYPQLDCSVAGMHLNNLVILELFKTKFTDDSKVWDIIKMATKLKSLVLVRCTHLTRTPNLSRCLNLERLTFDNCGRLKEIDNSIGRLTCLLDLNITHCELIERVPDEIGGLVKLERFSLESCYKVRGLPTSIGNLSSLGKLDLSNTGITSLPYSIGKLRCLSDLILKDTKIKQLPDSIGKLKFLCTLDLSCHRTEVNSNQWELPKAIGMLEKLEVLYLGYRKDLAGKIPDEIGHLTSLRVLDFCWTRIYQVPGTINMLSCLSTLDLIPCDEITELPELPANLVHLRVKSHSLQLVPNLSKLTDLVELVLSDGSDFSGSSNLRSMCDLGWIGRLFKLRELELCLLNITAPPIELGSLSLLEDLSLCSLDLKPLEQLPPSLLSLKLDNFSSTGTLLSNLEIPSNLTLCFLRLQEIQLNGLSQLQCLNVDRCDLRSLFIPSSLTTLRVFNCPNMVVIQFLGMSASLEELSISDCQSIGGSLGVPNQSESSSIESTHCSWGILLLPNALKKLKRLRLEHCENLFEIQVTGTLLSLQDIFIKSCDAMEKLSGILNLKNLHRLVIHQCSKLRVVEGLDELEFLTELDVDRCPSLETLLDRLNSKIPDECQVRVSQCRYSLNSSSKFYITFKRYKKMMAQQGAPQSETNKEEAKMEGDAEEPDTELQVQFHPCASPYDHDISKELPIDNVREGIMLGNQNQTGRQGSNPLSISPLSSTQLQFQFHPFASSWDHDINEEPPIDDVREGKLPGNQNQMREQDSNHQSISPLSSTDLQLQFHPSARSWDHEINEEPPIDNVREETLPGNQNQTREQDSNPQSLDELARPRTFSDRFKTCLVSILECICNHDFPSL